MSHHNNRVHQAASNEPSSEVASDEAWEDQRGNDLDNTQLDVDLGLSEPTWEESDGEESESVTSEDAGFTSQPLGVDLQPAEPVDTPESSPITVEFFNGAAEVIEVLKNRFAQLWEGDKLYGLRKIAGSHYPFSGTVEFTGVEKFLQYLPMGRINDFLRLDYVRLTIVLLLLAMLTMDVAGQAETLLFFVCTRITSTYRSPSQPSFLERSSDQR